jgi:DNA-binding HxlR family transcriptional regulator
MASYSQFCPVAKAAEVLCERWTLLIVRELFTGSTRFRDLQRGLPGCPPATLAKRLKELVAAGVVDRHDTEDGISYVLTAAGAELYPIVESFGVWGQRWVRSTYEASELDIESLLWSVRPFLDPKGLGVDEAVVQLQVTVPPGARRHFWVVVEDEEVDLCLVDPLRQVDVVIDADVRSLAQIWMGDLDFAEAVEAGTLVLHGPADLTRRIPAWFGQHPILAPIKPATAS